MTRRALGALALLGLLLLACGRVGSPVRSARDRGERPPTWAPAAQQTTALDPAASATTVDPAAAATPAEPEPDPTAESEPPLEEPAEEFDEGEVPQP